VIVSFDLFTPTTGIEEKDVPTEYIRYDYAPGSADVVHHKASDEEKSKYAEAYARFKRGEPPPRYVAPEPPAPRAPTKPSAPSKVFSALSDARAAIVEKVQSFTHGHREGTEKPPTDFMPGFVSGEPKAPGTEEPPHMKHKKGK